MIDTSTVEGIKAASATPVKASAAPITTQPGKAWITNDGGKTWVKPPQPATGAYVWNDVTGWTPDPKANTSKGQFITDTGFQLSATLMSDPIYGEELTAINNALIANDETLAENLYYKSKWFTTLGKTAAARYTLMREQNSVYLTELSTFKAKQKARLLQLGVKVDDANFEAYLEKAYLGNLTDDQINAFVANSKDFGHTFGGSTLSAMQDAKVYANSMGIAYSSSQLESWGKDLFLGKTTQADIEKNIRDQAASTYPAYKEWIDKGVSMDQISSAYKQSMASILEINPNAISWNDPTLRTALQGSGTDTTTSSANGQAPTTVPIWKFEQQLRNDPRWQYTNNARDQVYQMISQVKNDFGI